MSGKKQLLDTKLKIQRAKNKIRHVHGVEVLDIFESDENILLNKILADYSPLMCSASVKPYSSLPFKSSDAVLYSWIISNMQLENDQDYFFLCDDIWASIKIVDLQLAVKSLWEHNSEKQVGTLGFLLVNTSLGCIMEVGCDSRDEEHYLIDVWHCSTNPLL